MQMTKSFADEKREPKITKEKTKEVFKYQEEKKVE